MKCPNCNSIIPDDSKFCPDCGEAILNIDLLKKQAYQIVTSYKDGYEHFLNLGVIPPYSEYLTSEGLNIIISKADEIKKKHSAIRDEYIKEQQIKAKELLTYQRKDNKDIEDEKLDQIVSTGRYKQLLNIVYQGCCNPNVKEYTLLSAADVRPYKLQRLLSENGVETSTFYIKCFKGSIRKFVALCCERKVLTENTATDYLDRSKCLTVSDVLSILYSCSANKFVNIDTRVEYAHLNMRKLQNLVGSKLNKYINIQTVSSFKGTISQLAQYIATN